MLFRSYREEFLENETIEKILKGEILLDTYSFRHTFATQLRKAKISEDDIGLILGHKKNQTQKYGSIPAKEFSNRDVDLWKLKCKSEKNAIIDLSIFKDKNFTFSIGVILLAILEGVNIDIRTTKYPIIIIIVHTP